MVCTNVVRRWDCCISSCLSLHTQYCLPEICIALGQALEVTNTDILSWPELCRIYCSIKIPENNASLGWLPSSKYSPLPRWLCFSRAPGQPGQFSGCSTSTLSCQPAYQNLAAPDFKFSLCRNWNSRQAVVAPGFHPSTQEAGRSGEFTRGLQSEF